MPDWLNAVIARQQGDWETLHLLFHEQHDGIEPGYGRLVITDGRCMTCGALITPSKGA